LDLQSCSAVEIKEIVRKDKSLVVLAVYCASSRYQARSEISRVGDFSRLSLEGFELEERVDSEEFIHRKYRRAPLMKKVKNIFLEECQILLSDFLKKAQYSSLIEELESSQFHCDHVPGLHSVSVLQNPGKSLKEIISFFQSGNFLKFLGEATSLKIQAIVPTVEILRLSAGDFISCESGSKLCRSQSGLDVYFFLCLSNLSFSSKSGGSLVYLDVEDNEPLVDLVPSSNTLGLVYRADDKCLRYLKYLKKTCLLNQHLYVISASFQGE
jgi:hypothetical protein